MQKLFSVSVFLLVTSLAAAQGISFYEGPWKEALAKAKSENKILFVDAFAKWCGPCKAMAKNVFTQQKVGDFFNANFINLKLDMEEADGVTFGHKYPVQAYPTLFFLDGDGKVVKTVRGGQQVDGLIALAADAIKKNDRSGIYEAKYKEGDRSYDLVFNYVKALNTSGKPSLKIANEYLDSNPDITEQQRLTFLLEAATEADSRLFDKVVTSKKDIINLVGKTAFDEKCKIACEKSVTKAIDFEMEELLTETIDKYKKVVPDQADIFSAKARMTYNKAFKKAGPYQTAYKQLAKATDNDPAILEFIIQDILGHFELQSNLVKEAADMADDLLEAREDQASLQLYTKAMVAAKESEKASKEIRKCREKAEKSKKDLQIYDSILRYLDSVKS